MKLSPTRKTRYETNSHCEQSHCAAAIASCGRGRWAFNSKLGCGLAAPENPWLNPSVRCFSSQGTGVRRAGEFGDVWAARLPVGTQGGATLPRSDQAHLVEA